MIIKLATKSGQYHCTAVEIGHGLAVHARIYRHTIDDAGVPREWIVSDIATGQFIGDGKTRDGAIVGAMTRLSDLATDMDMSIDALLDMQRAKQRGLKA